MLRMIVQGGFWFMGIEQCLDPSVNHRGFDIGLDDHQCLELMQFEGGIVESC